MQEWIKLHQDSVKHKTCGPELFTLPRAAYDDERVWNQVYVALHESVTTGPMIMIVHRFVQHVRPEFLWTIEHRAFIERVATDGLRRNPPHLIPHYVVREAAKLFKLLAMASSTPHLAEWATEWIQQQSLTDDVDTHASVLVQESHTRFLSDHPIPGAMRRVCSVVACTHYSKWKRTYDAMRLFAQRHDGWDDDDRRALFERFVHAAGSDELPHPWLLAAASLYPTDSSTQPRSTPALRLALRRVQTTVPGWCDAWYVRRLAHLSPYSPTNPSS